MTQPNDYKPEGAANYDSFAGFAGTTQEEWDAVMRGGVEDRFSIMSGICMLLEQIPFIGDLIERGGGAEGAVWGPVGALIDGIVGVFARLCEIFLGHEPTDQTTPTSMLGGFSFVFDLFLDNPFVSGLADFLDGPTGDLIFDILNGFIGFFTQFLGFFTGFLNPGGIIDSILNMIDSLVGIFGGGGVGNFLEDLVNLVTGWVPNIPFIGDIIQAITGIFSGDFSVLSDFFDNIPLIGDIFDSGGKILTSILNVPASIITGVFSLLQIPQLNFGKVTGLDGFLNSLMNGLNKTRGVDYTNPVTSPIIVQSVAANNLGAANAGASGVVAQQATRALGTGQANRGASTNGSLQVVTFAGGGLPGAS